MRFTNAFAISMAATSVTSFVLPSLSPAHGVTLSALLLQVGLASAYVVPPAESLRKLRVRKAISVIVHRRQAEVDSTTSLDASPTDDPTTSIDPTASVDPTASIDPTATEDPITSTDPTATLDPTASVDPGTTQDPITSIDPTATQDPISSVDPTATAEPTGWSNQPDEPGHGGNSSMPGHCHHPHPPPHHHPGHGKPAPHMPHHHKGNRTHHGCHPHKPGHGGSNSTQPTDTNNDSGDNGQTDDNSDAPILDTTVQIGSVDGGLTTDQNASPLKNRKRSVVRKARTQPGFSTLAGTVVDEEAGAGGE